MDNLALAINPSFLLLKEWIVTAGLSSVAYQLRIKSPKTGWPECSGTVAGLHWNRWPESAGISGRNGAENARWITVTHTQRWHAHRQSFGSGPVYQGRFRSFPVQTDEHFLTVARYVERNALRAKRGQRSAGLKIVKDWGQVY